MANHLANHLFTDAKKEILYILWDDNILYRFFMSNKGQFSVEYFVVLILFLSFSLYFAFRLLDFYPKYLENVEEEILRSDSYRLSEILVSDDGYPLDWEDYGAHGGTSYIKRIGLSDQSMNASNYLSLSKITQMGVLCSSDYEKVKSLLGIQHDFLMMVEDTGGSLSMQCGASDLGEIAAAVTRVVAFNNGDYGKVTLYMGRFG